MGWRSEAGHETGDEPDPGFGPPRHGMHHDAEADDIANAALYLNSDLAAKVTGVTLPVDAGHLTLSGYNPASTR